MLPFIAARVSSAWFTRVSLKNIAGEIIRVGWHWPGRNCLGNFVRERSHDLVIPFG